MRLCENRIATGLDRRTMLQSLAFGFGWTAFNGIAGAQPRLDDPLAPKKGHHTATAKRVIFLYMNGAPSHVDTFDYKPALARLDGTEYRRNAKLLKSPWEFRPRGKSGLMISDLFPEVGGHADDLCLLRGMKAGIPAHAQASLQMHTGSFQFVRPSMGAWSVYGLGSTNENLPGFVTINPGGGGGVGNYSSAFLPASYQGTPVALRRNQDTSEAIPNIRNDVHGDAVQRRQLTLLRQLERERERRSKGLRGLEGVLEQYELAFRMQAEVPDVVDLGTESRKTLEMYGIGEAATDGFGRQCLLARRLAEEGVRFIELSAGGWDTHRNMREALAERCTAVDRPIAGLLADLKQRRMLDDTLVIWGGEFGRTPYAQGDDGRDHNARGFTMWMAGGGVRGGLSYGETDETGGEAVSDVMDIHDWHATILYALGLDHERLTFNHSGRDYRLTDVHGNVHRGIFTSA